MKVQFSLQKSQSRFDSAVALERLFSALGDRTRLGIIKSLKENPGICVGELAVKLGVSSSAISQHCRLLEVNNVLERKREGQRICYALSERDPIVSKCLRVIA